MLSNQAKFYFSYSRGLKESGVAPAYAANRNRVLNAQLSTQYEAGLRLTTDSSLKAIIAMFNTQKPYNGLNSQSNRYEQIANVRHRGLEASLSGPITENTSVIIGGVYMQPSLSGASVESGVVGERPIGVPEQTLIANVNQRFANLSQLSLDVGFKKIGAKLQKHSWGATVFIFGKYV